MARSFASASSQYLEKTGVNILTAYPVSMACWMKTSDTSAVTGSGVMVADASTNIDWMGLGLRFNSQVVRWHVSDSGGTLTLDTVATYTTGNWVHCAGVSASATDHRVYIDGGSKITSATSRTPTFANQDVISIGRLGRSTPAAYHNGLIAFCAAWNGVALSDAEVSALSSGLSPLCLYPSKLVLWAPCAGASSPENDFVGGNHLTVTGATASNDNPTLHFIPRHHVSLPKFQPICRWADVPNQVMTADFRIGVAAFHKDHDEPPPSLDYTIIPASGTYGGTATSTGNTTWEEDTRLSGLTQPTPPVLGLRTDKIHQVGGIDVDISQFSAEDWHTIEATATATDGGKRHKNSDNARCGLQPFKFYVDNGGLTYRTKYVSTTGNDTTGDGTSGTPYRTIAKAIDVLETEDSDFSDKWDIIINGAGTYSFADNGFTLSSADREFWVTVKADDGLNLGDVKIRPVTDTSESGSLIVTTRVEFYKIAFEHSGTALGFNWYNNNHYWFHYCTGQSDKNTAADPPTRYIFSWQGLGTKVYYTEWSGQDLENCCGDENMRPIQLARNIYGANLWDDLLRNPFWTINVEMVEAQETANHIDIVQISSTSSSISNTTARNIGIINIRNDEGRGNLILSDALIGGTRITLSDIAVINCYLRGTSVSAASGMFSGDTSRRHFVHAHITCRHDTDTSTSAGSFRLGGGTTSDPPVYMQYGIVKGVSANRHLVLGKSWANPTWTTNDTIIQRVTFDENNTYNVPNAAVQDYHDTSSPVLGDIASDNWTKADPALDANGSPTGPSNLKGRIARFYPIDLAGFTRGTTSSSAGAYEGALIPTKAALTITGYAPTVRTGPKATPTNAALTITAYAPTVLTPRLVTPTKAALTVTAYAPVVTVGNIATPTTANLTATAYAPTVLTPRLVTPTKAALTATAYVPSVLTPVTATPTKAALTITAYAPSVSVETIVGKASLTLTSYAPAVATPRRVTPSKASLTIDTHPPTVSGAVEAEPGKASLTITGYAPTVTTPNSITVTKAALTIAAYAPTIPTPGVVTPTKAALTVTAYAPDVAVAVVVPKASLTLTAYAPTAATPVVARPPKSSSQSQNNSLVIRTYAPQISPNVLVNTDKAALTVATYAPTVSAPRLATPTTASLTIGTYAPAAEAPILVTPSKAALTLTSYSGDLQLTANIVITKAALTLQTYAPTIAGTGFFIPGPYKVAAVEVFQPGAVIAESFQPGAVEREIFQPGAVAGEVHVQ